MLNPWELFNKIEQVLKDTISVLSDSRVIAYIEWAMLGFLGHEFWGITEAEYQMWWKLNIKYEGAIEE